MTVLRTVEHKRARRGYVSVLGTEIGDSGDGGKGSGIVQREIEGNGPEKIIEIDAVTDAATQGLEKNVNVRCRPLSLCGHVQPMAETPRRDLIDLAAERPIDFNLLRLLCWLLY